MSLCFRSSPSLNLIRPTISNRGGLGISGSQQTYPREARPEEFAFRPCKDFMAQHASVFEAGDLTLSEGVWCSRSVD